MTMRLRKLCIKEGVWIGSLRLEGDTAGQPRLEATHLDAAVPGIRLTQDPDDRAEWRVTVPIPAAALGDGVHTVVIRDPATGDRLDAFTIVTGDPLEDDIRAEVGLLRAELDMLKQAFRRHCRETTN